MNDKVIFSEKGVPNDPNRKLSYEEMIYSYEQNIADIEKKTQDHRKLCDCGACELLKIYDRMRAKYEHLRELSTWNNTSLMKELERRLWNLNEWASGSSLNDAKRIEIEALNDVYSILWNRANASQLCNTDETGHPTLFNWEDVDSLRDSLADNIMPIVQRELENSTFIDKVPSSYQGDFIMACKKAVEAEIEITIKHYFQDQLEQSEGCLHEYEWSNGCGARVCHKCGDHKGLAKCYCGWNLQPGEVLEDDVPY